MKACALLIKGNEALMMLGRKRGVQKKTNKIWNFFSFSQYNIHSIIKLLAVVFLLVSISLMYYIISKVIQ